MPLNVLFIVVDDLRPQLSHLGSFGGESTAFMHTPNLDAFATSEAISFRNARCQQAICGPSRTSVLLGRRPDATQVYTNRPSPRETCVACETIFQRFKGVGYHTAGLGKLFGDDNRDLAGDGTHRLADLAFED